MAINNAVNLQNAAFTATGAWAFSNASYTLSGLASATNTNIVYIDPASGLLSKGAVPGASGGGVVNAVQSQLTTSGTFTLNVKCLYLYVECWGGGGGGGGAFTSSNSNVSVGGGGAGGSYSAQFYTAAAAGSSFSYTVGAAGLGATGTGIPATAGGTSSLLTQTAGGGGAGASGGDNSYFANYGFGTNTTVGVGGFLKIGNPGLVGIVYPSPVSISVGGAGGDSFGFQGAAYGRICGTGTAFAGVTPQGVYAGGGSGGSIYLTTSAFTNGGNGGPGLIRITQYLSA